MKRMSRTAKDLRAVAQRLRRTADHAKVVLQALDELGGLRNGYDLITHGFDLRKGL